MFFEITSKSRVSEGSEAKESEICLRASNFDFDGHSHSLNPYERILCNIDISFDILGVVNIFADADTDVKVKCDLDLNH